MDNNEKILFFTNKLQELSSYKNGLTSDKLKEFEILKQEIFQSLSEKQRIRFNKISFYSEVPAPPNYDDLPF